jgi:hypothetical protein
MARINRDGRPHPREREPVDTAALVGGPGVEEVPEDVRAEEDAEDRVATAALIGSPADEPLPDDVLAERDREMRLAQEELRLRQAEGRPPDLDAPRP